MSTCGIVPSIILCNQLRGGLEHYQHDLVRLTDLHQNTAHELQQRSREAESLQKELHQSQQHSAALRRSLDEERARVECLSLQSEELQRQEQRYLAQKRETDLEVQRCQKLVHLESSVSGTIGHAVSVTQEWRKSVEALKGSVEELGAVLATS